jgi:hypothetical protein
MEHNTDNIWALPQEINELIFGLSSVAELCKLRVVSKSIRDSLSIQRIWKVIPRQIIFKINILMKFVS